MNKKLLISLGIILVLLAYLFFNKRGSSVDLPEMEKWEGHADEILISNEDNKTRIIYKNGKWLINDEGYPADEKVVSGLEKKLNDLLITDLISEKPYYDMYSLDKAKAMRITVKKGGKSLRDILLGKKSSTGKQTYIKLNDDKNIYLASGDLSRDFNVKVEDLRDKEIFKVVQKAIESLELTYNGRKLTFSKIMEEKKDDKEIMEEKKEEPQDKKPKKEEKWICNEYKNIELNENTLNGILNSFNPLKADSFPKIEKASLRQSPSCRIKLRAYSKDIELSIFSKDKDDDKKYVCSSSESPYVFTMTEWKAKKYFKTISDLKK